MKNKSLLTRRLLRRAEILLEYNFGVIYSSGKDNVVLDFLSKICLVKLTSTGEDEKEKAIARSINKIFVPFANRSQILERAHIAHTGHLKTS